MLGSPLQQIIIEAAGHMQSGLYVRKQERLGKRMV